jgi:hypothetical protein
MLGAGLGPIQLAIILLSVLQQASPNVIRHALNLLLS